MARVVMARRGRGVCPVAKAQVYEEGWRNDWVLITE